MKWHQADRRVAFGAQKSQDFQTDPDPYQSDPNLRDCMAFRPSAAQGISTAPLVSLHGSTVSLQAQCLHCENTIPGRASMGLCLHYEHTTQRCASTAVLQIYITLIADPAFFTLMWIWIRKPGLPPSTISFYNSLKFKCNDDIHFCFLVLISPWWIGGARSEATHSPQLLMHKEKAGEG